MSLGPAVQLTARPSNRLFQGFEHQVPQGDIRYNASIDMYSSMLALILTEPSDSMCPAFL